MAADIFGIEKQLLIAFVLIYPVFVWGLGDSGVQSAVDYSSLSNMTIHRQSLGERLTAEREAWNRGLTNSHSTVVAAMIGTSEITQDDESTLLTEERSSPLSLSMNTVDHALLEGVNFIECHAQVEDLSNALRLPCFNPPATPITGTSQLFWFDLASFVRDPEALFAIEHASMMDRASELYYTEVDLKVSRAIANLSHSEANEHSISRTEIANQYAQLVATFSWSLADLVVFSLNVNHRTLFQSLPTFSGALFWRGLVKPRSSWIWSCLGCKGPLVGGNLNGVLHNEVYSLRTLGLAESDFFLASRKPYPDWHRRQGLLPNEIRVILLCMNCRYVHPFLRKEFPDDFDAAAVIPSNGFVRVLEMVGSLQTLILSEF